MTQQILMILPEQEGESPRLVGPFLTEATAAAWANRKQIAPVRRMIRPLESPTSIYGYGRHALIPSPTARRVAGVLGEAVLVKPTVPLRRDGGPELHARLVNPKLGIEGEREETLGAPPLTGGIRHWVAGDALETAPWNVMGSADVVANWSGPIARFNHPTDDGRVLALNEPIAGDWIGHFARIPVGVWVMVPNVGALPIGLCERVRVEDGWLHGEGRISIMHFKQAAPELFAKAFPFWESGKYTADMLEELIPAAVDVTNCVHSESGGTLTIGGPWELERVVFGSVPAWPGCQVRFGDLEMR